MDFFKAYPTTAHSDSGKIMHSPPYILIVDDDVLSGHLVSRALEKANYRIETVRDVVTAEAIFIDNPPDILILDVLLEEANGLDILEEMGQRYPDMPVIMQTAHGVVQTAIDALRKGAFDFWPKPSRPAMMRESVERAVALRRRRELHNRKLADAALTQLASQNMVLLGRLVQGLTHEINNPLSAIRLNVDMIQHTGELDNKNTKRAKSILASMKRIEEVMLALNAFLPADEEPKEVVIADLIDLTIAELQTKDVLTHCQIETQFDEDIPALKLRPKQMKRAFRHILENASEAARHMEGGCKVEILAKIKQKEVELSFYNNGPAISPDMIDQIFSPDYTTRQHEGRMKGLGLGLYVVRSVVEINGGRLEVESSESYGVCFRMHFPLDPKRNEEAPA